MAIDIIAEEGSEITRSPLRKQRFPRGALLGGVVHKDKGVEIATGNTVVKANDRAIVFCLPHTIEKTEKLFRGQRND